MAGSQKLTWFKSLAGADLTPSEFRILVLLANYSNAEMGNAHPGVERLAADAGLSERQVWRILDSLEAKQAIAVTQYGGNKVFKGAATVYKILTPPKRSKGDTDDTLKGDTHDTLHDAQPDQPNTPADTPKGDISGTKGDISGQTRVSPMSPQQVNTSGPIEHADSSESGSPAPQMSARHGEDQDENDDHYDIASILEKLSEELGYLDPGEEAMAEAMLQRGTHPNAVRNKINKDRYGAVSVAMSLAQKRLDEELRCTICGTSKSRHARWIAEIGNLHPFVAEK